MTGYLFEPKSPLVLRTGRPSDQMGDPQTHSFPLPSTIAGAWRTCYGDQLNYQYTAQQQQQLRAISVQGPIAVQINAVKAGAAKEGAAKDTSDGITALFPKPNDAFYHANDSEHNVVALKPEPIGDDEYVDLPKTLQPVLLPISDAPKPPKGDPWWNAETMYNWLQHEAVASNAAFNNLGWGGPLLESRTHTQLSAESGSADDGNLFQTQNAYFSARQSGLNSEARFGFMVNTSTALPTSHDHRRIGAEGRVASVKHVQAWPKPPQSLIDAVDAAENIRIILATPAVFGDGFIPAWLRQGGEGRADLGELNLELCAVSNAAWQPLSGWDIAQHRAKPVRKMVPAGAVYWLKKPPNRKICEQLWLQSICDDRADQNDGFGLALLGIWKKN
jgi:CRISPR-associated protein Cmr3